MKFDELASDIASERENTGFDNYVDRIRRALFDAYIAGSQRPSAEATASFDDARECDCWDVHTNLDLTEATCGCPCHMARVEGVPRSVHGDLPRRPTR